VLEERAGASWPDTSAVFTDPLAPSFLSALVASFEVGSLTAVCASTQGDARTVIATKKPTATLRSGRPDALIPIFYALGR
jgi:hypothetical protein